MPSWTKDRIRCTIQEAGMSPQELCRIEDMIIWVEPQEETKHPFVYTVIPLHVNPDFKRVTFYTQKNVVRFIRERVRELKYRREG
jgi:hypothetical protein